MIQHNTPVFSVSKFNSLFFPLAIITAWRPAIFVKWN